jgi:hypothetical protein
MNNLKLRKIIKDVRNYDLNKLKELRFNSIYTFIMFIINYEIDENLNIPFSDLPCNDEGILGIKSIDIDDLEGTPLKDLIIGPNGSIHNKNEYKLKLEDYYEKTNFNKHDNHDISIFTNKLH